MLRCFRPALSKITLLFVNFFLSFPPQISLLVPGLAVFLQTEHFFCVCSSESFKVIFQTSQLQSSVSFPPFLCIICSQILSCHEGEWVQLVLKYCKRTIIIIYSSFSAFCMLILTRFWKVNKIGSNFFPHLVSIVLAPSAVHQVNPHLLGSFAPFPVFREKEVVAVRNIITDLCAFPVFHDFTWRLSALGSSGWFLSSGSS